MSVPRGTCGRGNGVPGTGAMDGCEPVWELRTEPGSSAGAAGVLNY